MSILILLINLQEYYKRIYKWSKYEGEWKYDKKEGKRKYYFNNGEKYDG